MGEIASLFPTGFEFSLFAYFYNKRSQFILLFKLRGEDIDAFISQDKCQVKGKQSIISMQNLKVIISLLFLLIYYPNLRNWFIYWF